MSQLDVFETIQPVDGFHVVQPPGAAVVSLYCVSYSGGAQAAVFSPDDPEAASVEIASWDYPTPAGKGECQRLKLVVDSICRYLTTGGSWPELSTALSKMQRVAAGGLTFPGWDLTDSYSTNAGGYEHVFVRSDGSGVVMIWSEPMRGESDAPIGGEFHLTTLEALAAMEEENDDVDDAGGFVAGPPDPPSLSAGEGH